MDLRHVFIGNLKKFRKMKGLSQMKLAECCDISSGFIGSIEVGSCFPSVEMIERIAQTLQVQPYLLFFDGQSRDIETETALQKPVITEEMKEDLIQQLAAGLTMVTRRIVKKI
jgi:transcriptional regulator with XRE-family HTH domain